MFGIRDGVEKSTVNHKENKSWRLTPHVTEEEQGAYPDNDAYDEAVPLPSRLYHRNQGIDSWKSIYKEWDEREGK